MPSKFLAIAVADGLGSAAQSDVGAAAAVQAAVESVKQSFGNSTSPDDDLRRIVEDAVHASRNALEAKAVREGSPLRDLACTLIVAVAASGTLAVAHVGDGAVVAETERGLELVSGPAESEYVNEVVPLTSNFWERALRIGSVVATARYVFVFTDGCQRAALKKMSDGLIPFEGFFAPLVAYAQDVKDVVQGTSDLESLLASQKMSEVSDDDKTLVVGVLGFR